MEEVMAIDRCVLVDLEGGMRPDVAREHLFELRDRLGPDTWIDVRWRGDPIPHLPAATRVLDRGSGARALAAAAARASGIGPLVGLRGPVLPDAAAFDGILAAFERDPLIGFAQPRFGDAAGEGIWSLPDGATGPELLPRHIVGGLPEHYLTTERLAACLAVRRDVAAGFSTSPDAAEDVRAALARELCQARRRGYRNLVVNRVVVPTPEPPGSLYPTLDPGAREALVARFPDVPTAEAWFAGAAHQRLERVVAKARRSRPSNALSVLLDCRGAQAHHNGTSQAILGLLDGLKAESPRWSVELLCNADAVEYHGIASRYPAMRIHTGVPDGTYAVAVRLDQPWDLSTVSELHRRAAAVAFTMLDTISWDTVYPCGAGVEKAWRFVAEHADGLLYISDFTRRRFGFRFPVADGVAEVVTHLSLHPDEYREAVAEALPESDHILVFGNHYDHKAVAPTVELLAGAFPYERIQALGMTFSRHNVTVQQSGHLSNADIERLVATARLIVFPSYYEGFGLPVLKGLAYGRTVVVRESPIWRELAALTRASGRLVPFTAPHELVEVVGRALAGAPLETLPLGTDLGDRGPPRWRDCARRIVELVEATTGRSTSRHWLAREHALALGPER